MWKLTLSSTSKLGEEFRTELAPLRQRLIILVFLRRATYLIFFPFCPKLKPYTRINGSSALSMNITSFASQTRTFGELIKIKLIIQKHFCFLRKMDPSRPCQSSTIRARPMRWDGQMMLKKDPTSTCSVKSRRASRQRCTTPGPGSQSGCF